jgi:hypothetical protein
VLPPFTTVPPRITVSNFMDCVPHICISLDPRFH